VLFRSTTLVSERHRSQAIEQIDRAWEESSSAGSVRTEWGEAIAMVRIPRFGAAYRIPVFEGTGDDALATGYGHYDGTAAPGQPGNFAIAAHRITHGQPLRSMPDLRAGDEVIVETASEVFTYRLTSGGDDLTAGKDAGWVLDPVPANPGGGLAPDQADGQALLTVTTCAELFHTDDRLVAFGVLVDTRPR
jgi:sortase A